MPKKIILDTDPGSDFDDVYAIVLAVNSPELELEGITIVAGNANLRARIALKLLKLLGKEEVPVVKGCEMPLLQEKRPWWTTFNPWGHEGKGFLTSEDDQLQPTPGHASDFMISKVTEFPGAITLVPIGPLTNIALAIIKEPKIVRKVKEIVAMGGVINPHQFGIPPILEHNFSSDPEAAKVVLNSGIPFTMIGLNVTLKVQMTVDRFNQLKSYHTTVVDGLVEMTERWFEVVKRDWSELHDPVAVGTVIDRSFVKTEKFYIDCKIENGVLKTIPYKRVEFIPTKEPHIEVGVDVEGDRFWDFFIQRITKK